MLSNANTLLSLYGYPPPDCLKLKHWSFSYIADLQAKKEKSLFSCKYFSFNSVFGKITWLNNGKGREKWGVFPPDCPLGKNKNRWDLCCRTVWLCKETGKSQVTNGVNLGNFSFKAAKQH